MTWRGDYITVRTAKNGRTAIYLREDKDTPWVQVESHTGGSDPLSEYCSLYNVDDIEVRRNLIRDAKAEYGDDWGDDAAVEPPT